MIIHFTFTFLEGILWERTLSPKLNNKTRSDGKLKQGISIGMKDRGGLISVEGEKIFR